MFAIECVGKLEGARKSGISFVAARKDARADSRADVERFGKAHREWFASFLGIPNRIPSRDTLGRVFAIIEIERFQRCFAERVKPSAN